MKNFIKLFKGSGWLNILGMTVALAAIYIIMVQVNYDLGYNKQIKDVDRIYIMTMPSRYVEGKYSTWLNRPLPRKTLDQSSYVDCYGLTLSNSGSNLEVKTSKANIQREYKLKTLAMTYSLLDIMDIRPIIGSLEGMSTNKYVAISESAASRMDVGLGDVIQYTPENSPTVCAIYKDIPLNRTNGGVEAITCYDIENGFFDDWSEWSFIHYIKLHSPNDKETFEAQALETVKDFMMAQTANVKGITQEQIDERIKALKVTLVPLKDVYFNHEIDAPLEAGNKTTTITLLVISLLIMIVTLINYINFFLSQIPSKLKSVNTRKILGSSRTSLVLGFMAESGILVVLSMILACAVILIFKGSTYANLVTSSLDFSQNLFVIALIIVVALIMTLASSICPALYITSFPMALALKGTMGQTLKGRSFRYLLVGFQFVVSLIFLICTCCIKYQYDYMMNYDMGFDKENLFNAFIPVNGSNKDAFTNELLKQSAIKDIAWADGPIVNPSRMGWGRGFKGENINFQCYPVSYNFLKFMGIQVVGGRDFTASDEKNPNGIFIFNQKAKNEFNMTLNDQLKGHRGMTSIAGFCEDFQFKPLQYQTSPFAFYIMGTEPWRDQNYLYIRSNSGITFKEMKKAVKDVVAHIMPEYNQEKVRVRFFDEELGRQYTQEKQLIQLVTLFAVISIVISLMGIIGLLMFETAFRRKEIGIRRVHGAEIAEILLMFNRKFVYILMVSLAVAAPVSYCMMDYYYSNFAYRAPMQVWIFVLAFLVVLVVTVLVITLCTYKSANENPSESLTNE